MGSYKLTVGNVVGITTDTNDATLTFGNNEFNVSIETLTYKKKIFAPNEINIVLSVKAKDSSSTTFPTLSQLQATFSRKKVTLIDTTNPDVTLADNYFVYKMKPCRSKDSNGSVILKVELSIFSMDKLMTIDKYCNVFTAKRLGEDIFKGELDKFWLDSGNQLKGEVNMQMLAFENKNTKAASEVRQPYLVQYNETFYDFLARSAIRCGEMLYFEGGLLHLGMKPVLTKASEDQLDVTDTVDFEDCMERVLAVQDRHYNFVDRSSKNDNRYTDSYFELVGAIKEEYEESNETSKDDANNTTNNTTTNTTNNTTDQTTGNTSDVTSDPMPQKKPKKTISDDGLTTTYEFERGKVTISVNKECYKATDTAPDNQLAGQPKTDTTTITVTDNQGIVLWEQTRTVNYSYEKSSDEKSYKKDKKGKYVCSIDESEVTHGQNVQGVYNQPEANDANFLELKKNNYTNYLNEWYDVRVAALNLFCLAFNNTNLCDVAGDIAESLIKTSVDAGISLWKKNLRNNDTNLKPMKTADNPEQTDGSIYSLFTTMKSLIDEDNLTVNKQGNSVSLLKADFYTKMRHASQTVSRMLVRLNYGADDQGLCLGDVIKVDGGFYVVTQTELDKNGNYIVEAIPPFYQNISTDTEGNGKISSVIPCPPLMPEIPTVRTSEPQVAFVEDNLDPNRFGRVRVRYPWQSKNGDRSPWIRMATPFASPGSGVTFRPCTGDEVLLNYEDGNIERPYIVGSLQSQYVTDPWLPLPDRVIRSKNGHSITFNDKTDGLDFLLGMSPGLSFIRSLIPVYKPLISNQNMVDLTGGINISDRYGLYQIDMSSDKRTVNIASPLGKVTLNAFTGITISAPNGNIKIEGKNVSIAASNRLSLESGSVVSDRYLPTSLSGLGEDLATEVLDKTVGKWMDLSFFRTILEVFIRPVDGTLKIKSHTYVLIEAGKGSAQVGYNEFNHIEREGKRKLLAKNNYLYKGSFLGQLERTIDFLTGKINTIVDNIREAQTNLLSAAHIYDHQLTFAGTDYYVLLRKMKLDGQNDVIAHVHDKVAEKKFDIGEVIKDTDFEFDQINELKYELNAEEKEPKKQNKGETPDQFRARVAEFRRKRDADVTKKDRRGEVLEKARDVGTKYKCLYDAVKAWEDFDYTKKEKKVYFYTESLRNFIRNLEFYDQYKKNVIDGTIDRNQDFANINRVKLELRRKIVYKLIVEASNADNTFFSIAGGNDPGNYADDNDWLNFVNRIGAPGDTLSISNAATRFLKSYFKNGRLNEWQDMIGNPLKNKFKWSAPEDNGKILLSDTAGKTLHLSSGVNGGNPAVTDNLENPNNLYPTKLKLKLADVN